MTANPSQTCANQSREFQVFIKPAGPLCNLACRYCYYLEKESLYPEAKFIMPDPILERLIRGIIEASTEPDILFSWHGGEPALAGIDFFRNAVSIQKKYLPQGSIAVNGIQTNGTLLNEDWVRFLAEEKFIAGISLDGTKDMHDSYRQDREGRSVFDRTMEGLRLLQKHGIRHEILCVVHEKNVRKPLEIYRFFKSLNAQFITFLPLVEREPGTDRARECSVPADAWGDFLCSVFDEWKGADIGKVKVQIFEEAIRTAFGLEHTLCIFKKTCGGVPVVEHNGDFYSCDHFVDEKHRIGNVLKKSLVRLLEDPGQNRFGQSKLDTLPQYCRQCEVRDMCNGECPKNRFIHTPDGDPGLNCLCAGYKKFFTHARPFVDQVAALWKAASPPKT